MSSSFVLNDNILKSVKFALGIVPEFTAFDQQLIMYINTAFAALSQIGVGPEDGFYLIDGTEKWKDVLEDDRVMNMVQSVVYLRVKLLFDPPTGGVATACNEQINELEWRIRERYEHS